MEEDQDGNTVRFTDERWPEMKRRVHIVRRESRPAAVSRPALPPLSFVRWKEAFCTKGLIAFRGPASAGAFSFKSSLLCR